MPATHLTQQAAAYLHYLCHELPTRRVGSAGNQAATAYFRQVVAGFGFHTDIVSFDCLDWQCDHARLTAGDTTFAVQASPYSLGGRFAAPLLAAATPAELAALDPAGHILLLHRDLAGEQFMPKHFPFYNPEEHQQIIRLLETKPPLAIVAASRPGSALAGGLYPYPLFEDGDFNIPSLFMSEEEGQRLLPYVGRQVSYDVAARRIPATGQNVSARKGEMARRVVISAHIDSKLGTPGALDNGAGVVTLLLLAELLAGYQGSLGIELMPFNGEDYYAASGELAYLAQQLGRPEEILLNVNIDAAGYHQGRTAYSLYGCPAGITQAIHAAFAGDPAFLEGEPWYQSDHAIFAQQQIPAAAITSELMGDLFSHITHTERDTPDIIDCARLAGLAQALQRLVHLLNALA